MIDGWIACLSAVVAMLVFYTIARRRLGVDFDEISFVDVMQYVVVAMVIYLTALIGTNELVFIRSIHSVLDEGSSPTFINWTLTGVLIGFSISVLFQYLVGKLPVRTAKEVNDPAAD